MEGSRPDAMNPKLQKIGRCINIFMDTPSVKAPKFHDKK